MKDFDPIVCSNNCFCDCEDHVHFEEVDGHFHVISQKKYCDVWNEWCGGFGPDNVFAPPDFATGKKM